MKKLVEILRKESLPQMPVIGVNGYAGEMDGSRYLFAAFEIASKKEAASISIPDYVKLNYAEYHPGYGWKGSLAYNTEFFNSGDLELLNQFEWL